MKEMWIYRSVVVQQLPYILTLEVVCLLSIKESGYLIPGSLTTSRYVTEGN